LLDPKHPRAGLADEEKIWLQSMHTECLAQLALFPPGKARLLEDSSVISALEAVAVRGLSQEAQESAGKVRKRGLGPRFILKLIILPRQARDKHGQDSKKDHRFLAGTHGAPHFSAGQHWDQWGWRQQQYRAAPWRVAECRWGENAFFAAIWLWRAIILPRQARDSRDKKVDTNKTMAVVSSSVSAGHIMLSYQWDHQAIIMRVNSSLQRRGYATWFDVECMKVRKTASFFEFSLCLSRACLGKMIVF
jgi:hypothetical protein